MNINDIDNQIIGAFDRLVCEASRSDLLGEIAMQPNGRHEKAISDHFCDALNEQELDGASAVREATIGSHAYKYDILVRRTSEIFMAIEVKTPFTNHDGIRHKTRRNSDYLPKDMDSLKAALKDGVTAAYALVTPIGCYPADSNGEMIRLDTSIRKNETAVKAQYGITWPTRHDYETNPSNGKPEVDLAMRELADERGLKVVQLKGWAKVLLPSPKPNICTFLDCALYKVQLK